MPAEIMERYIWTRVVTIVACSFLMVAVLANASELSGFFGQLIGPPPIFPEEAVCGNAICEFGEDSSNCCSDCGCPAGKICNVISNVCYEFPEAEEFGIYLSDPKITGFDKFDPSIIIQGSDIKISVNATVERNSKVHRVWVEISVPDGSTKIVDLQGNAEGGIWETNWKVPLITGRYLAQFSAVDDQDNAATPINASFYVAMIHQIGGPAVPVSPPGY